MSDSVANRRSDPHGGQEVPILVQTVRACLRRPWVFLAILLGCIAASTAFAFLSQREYLATSTVIPVDASEARGGLSALAAQIGGLTGLGDLAGLGPARSETIEYLHARTLIGAYIQENQLLPLLFPDRWNESTKGWKANSAGPPTLGDGVRKFQEICSVIDDRRAGVIRITLRWPNRALAASWINGIVDKADSDLRQQALREAERSIEYLKNELARTTVVPLQEAIARLLEEQVKTMMYTRARDRFALRVIDAATVPGPRETVPPSRLAMMLIGTLLGAVLAAATCLALARRVLRTDTTGG